MSEVKLIAATQGADELEGKSPQDVISYVQGYSTHTTKRTTVPLEDCLDITSNMHTGASFETVSMTLEIIN